MQKQIQNNKAITLIALIITIIILLILTGVAISQLGENGLFGKAQQAKIEQMKAEAKENINLAIMEIQMRETSEEEKETTHQSLHDKLPTTNEKIGVNDYTQGETELTGVYTSNDKVSFKYIIDENFNVIIGELVGEKDKKFKITVDEVTTKSFRVTGDTKAIADLGATSFTYVATTLPSSEIKFEHITDTSYTVTGLEQGTTYKVYMIAYDNAGNERKSEEKQVTTESIPDGTREGAITFSEATWTNGTASITINTSTNYYIEYQINSVTGTWIKATAAGTSITVNGLNHGDVVYARLTDGTYSGKYANTNIADTVAPEEFEITVTDITQTGMKISGNTTDNESGIKDYIYVVEDLSGNKVVEHTTTNTNYTITDSNENLDADTKYNVYIIARDYANNTTESNKVFIDGPRTDYPILKINGIEGGIGTGKESLQSEAYDENADTCAIALEHGKRNILRVAPECWEGYISILCENNSPYGYGTIGFRN